ncbi:GNAT family N-acetyltransferase [Catellatospora sichuanensis]|uniref:GNAT family N-acetyltransferase n=1 Tax=Catellatospora sichuanensis TaxID=1969805 RepID=UPI0011824B3A|nr:GNAT family N-acetyltransferase [Catellatospora sichuanensis]
MFSVREATGPEIEQWRAEWVRRLRERYVRCYTDPATVDREVERSLANQRDDAGGRVYAVEAGGTTAGFLALGGSRPRRPEQRSLHDLWLAPEHRGRGLGRALVAWARERATSDGGSRLAVVVAPGDLAVDALFGAYPLRAQQMVKTVTAEVSLPAGVAGRPMTPADFGPWREQTIRTYAEEMAASGSRSPADALAASVAEHDELLPEGLRTAGHAFWCVAAGDEVVGTIWLRHAFLPGMSFVFGVDVDPAHRGRGYGRAAMLVGEQATAAAGDARLGLNVFGHNTIAMRLYDSMGYRIVEQYRAEDL